MANGPYRIIDHDLWKIVDFPWFSSSLYDFPWFSMIFWWVHMTRGSKQKKTPGTSPGIAVRAGRAPAPGAPRFCDRGASPSPPRTAGVSTARPPPGAYTCIYVHDIYTITIYNSIVINYRILYLSIVWYITNISIYRYIIDISYNGQ